MNRKEELKEAIKKIIFQEQRGLWDNIRAKRERGEAPAKKGEEGYPTKKQWDKLTKEDFEMIYESCSDLLKMDRNKVDELISNGQCEIY
jgi:hypothetical protein